MAEKKKRKRRQLKDRPVYFVVRKMVDPETGEVIGCLVPDGWINQRLMRERKYHTNDLLRATITHPRSVKFHRLVHQLGTLVRQNVEGFEDLDSHQAIKRLQREAGVLCDEETIVLPGVGNLQVLTPRSISFDSMDESDFRQFWTGICTHIIHRYWPGLTEDQIEAMATAMPESEAA